MKGVYAGRKGGPITVTWIRSPVLLAISLPLPPSLSLSLSLSTYLPTYLLLLVVRPSAIILSGPYEYLELRDIGITPALKRKDLIQQALAMREHICTALRIVRGADLACQR